MHFDRVYAARLTREQYEILLTAFRDKPKNATNAAKLAGIDVRTARRAFEEGWQRPDWARPIKQILEEEQAKLRAALYEEERLKHYQAVDLRLAREKAELDAREEKLREAQAVRAAVTAALGALAVSGHLSQAKIKLASRASELIVHEAELGKMTWNAAIALLQKLQKLDTDAANQLKVSMDILRLHLGPTSQFTSVTGAVSTALPELEGKTAADLLGGEEAFRQAVRDFADNKITPDVEKLIEYQTEVANRHKH